MDIHEIAENQRAFFGTHQTLDVPWRIRQLKKLRDALRRWTPQLTAALHEDLGRCETEAYLLDIGPAISEINECICHLRRWARPELHLSGLVCFPSLFTRVYKMPYGSVLILSPFNFPVLLSAAVLAAAISGGNTAVLKPSAKAQASAEVLSRMIGECFPPEYITVVQGGHEVSDACLAEGFDKIFYTGSPKVAHHVMEEAAKTLTPVALELGGETGNWAVVRSDADIRDAAGKIAFFKSCNAGQICINLNQVAVAKDVAEKFIEELKKALRRQLGEDPAHSPEYPRLISRKAYDACAETVDNCRDRVVYGGRGDAETLRYEPTLLYPVGADEPIVQRELFCPILPIVPFEDAKIDTLMNTIASRQHGLALYLFTRDKAWAKREMQRQQYGGGCINEVCVQLMVKGVPFGGTGHSGMGAYHGVWGFREFTHPSTVLTGKTRCNLPLRAHPYEGRKNSWKLKMIRLFER